MTLQSDPDRDVIEAVEHTDFELLQRKLKSKTVKVAGDPSEAPEETDEQRVAFQKGLLIREKEEIEERKKRHDDDEESKYDIAAFMAENKRWR